MIRNIAISFVLLAVFAGGCGRNDVGEKVGNGQGDVVDPCHRRDSDVLVVVNGAPVRCGDFKRRLDLERAIVKYRVLQKSNGKAREEDVSKYLDDYSKDRMPRLVSELVNNLLLSQTMSKHGLVISNEVAEKTIRNASRAFGVKKDGEKGVSARIGFSDAAYIRDQLLYPLRYKILREYMYPDCRTVTEKEVDEGLERQNRYYARAIASNTVTYATCSNVLAQIKAGTIDFLSAAKKYSQVGSAEDAEEGEEFDGEDFAPEDEEYKKHLAKLKKWAYSAKIGSVSGPWEMEDGLSIVKLLARSEGGAGVEDEPEEVKLARITFIMLEPEPEPRTREFVRESLLKWKANRAQKQMFEKLHAETKLEYPLGTNFQFTVSNATERK